MGICKFKEMCFEMRFENRERVDVTDDWCGGVPQKVNV